MAYAYCDQVKNNLDLAVLTDSSDMKHSFDMFQS